MIVLLTYQQEIHESNYGRPLPLAPWLAVAVVNCVLWLVNIDRWCIVDRTLHKVKGSDGPAAKCQKLRPFLGRVRWYNKAGLSVHLPNPYVWPSVHKKFPISMKFGVWSMSAAWWYAVWPDPRSRRSEICKNGWFQSLSSSPVMHVIRRLMMNCDTPRQ